MAQLDRATVCGTVGRRFESSWARSFFTKPIKGALFGLNRIVISHISTFFLKTLEHLRERWPSGLRRTLGKRV